MSLHVPRAPSVIGVELYLVRRPLTFHASTRSLDIPTGRPVIRKPIEPAESGAHSYAQICWVRSQSAAFQHIGEDAHMGLIQAAIGALGGTLADQWKALHGSQRPGTHGCTLCRGSVGQNASAGLEPRRAPTASSRTAAEFWCPRGTALGVDGRRAITGLAADGGRGTSGSEQTVEGLVFAEWALDQLNRPPPLAARVVTSKSGESSAHPQVAQAVQAKSVVNIVSAMSAAGTVRNCASRNNQMCQTVQCQNALLAVLSHPRAAVHAIREFARQRVARRACRSLVAAQAARLRHCVLRHSWWWPHECGESVVSGLAGFRYFPECCRSGRHSAGYWLRWSGNSGELLVAAIVGGPVAACDTGTKRLYRYYEILTSRTRLVA
ncbi:hypothetical protein FQA39_LY19363 [Lamprigera yunnana]|nr:hypothetical protein FQA39_LY19363 [Lamprigera yunnana]